MWKLSKQEQDFSQTSDLSYKPSASGPPGRARFSLSTHAKRPQPHLKSVNSPVTVHSSPSCRFMLGAFISLSHTHTLVHRSCVNAAVSATRCLSPQKGQTSVFRNNNLKERVLCTYFLKIGDLNTNEIKCLEGRGFSRPPRNQSCSRNLYLPLILKE